MSPPHQLPEALSRALDQKRLLIFCGAGISVPPPSYIPSWWSFNEALLEGAKQTTLETFEGIQGAAREAIQKLNLEQFTVEAFSHKIVESFAGSSYFPLLKVLESDRTNANHRAVAELARAGIARAIVTTNFDTLLERAFREKGLSLQVLAGTDDYMISASREVCTLLKIHGTVSTDASLVDTVGQKLRGLGIEVRTRLAEQFRQFHVLVIGFSGADLNFGNDYLALSSIGADSPGLTWLVRPGALVPSRVQEVVQAAGEGGCLLTADLPGFFERLGVAVDESAVSTAAGAAQKAKDRVKIVVREFFNEPHIGRFGAAALCSRLLSELGDFDALDSFHETLIKDLNSYGDEVPITAMLLFPILAFHAMHRGRFDEAAKWEWRQIKLCRAVIDAHTSAGRQPSAETQLEMRQNLAGAYNNLAIAALHSEKREEAIQYNKGAEQFAADPQSRRMLCRVMLTAAEIAEASDASADAILEKLRLSRAFALEAGEPATLAETALLETKVLLAVCECDSALDSLRKGRPYFRLQGGLNLKVQAAIHLATIARFRERNTVGLEILKRTRKMCVRLGASDFAETVVIEEIKLFGMCPKLRETLLAEIDSILPEFPSADDLLPKLRKALIGGEFNEPLQVRVRQFGASAREQKLRENVAKLEGSGEHELLGRLFQQLCNEKYEQRNFSRLADLAQAFGAAARRSGSAELKLSALNYVGIAREELGDLPGAQRAYDEILGAQPPPSEEFSAFAKHNRAIVGIRLGQLDEAERLLREALKANTARGDYTQAANNIRFLAKIEARRGNITNAIQIVDSAREIIEKAPEKRIAPTIALLRRELEQQRDGVPATLAVMERPNTRAAPTNRESFEQLRENAKTPSEMGNLGLVALELGLIEVALGLFAKAETGYANANDQLGVSRCLSNRADAASCRDRWQEAIDLAERAIAIRRGLGDIEGQILIGGSLAMWRMKNHQDEAAIEMARKVITQSTDRAPSASLLKAYVALIGAHGRRKELAQMKDAAKGFLKAWVAVENGEEFLPMLTEIRSLAEETPMIAPPVPERNELEAAMLEAERLQRSNNWKAAIAGLDAIDLSKLSDFQRARIFATRGNAFQTGGEFKESADMYAKAAVLFRGSNQESFAIQAEHQRAVSLRRLGDREGAEAQLRSIWANAKEGSLRAAAGQSLGNLLLEKVVELEKLVGAPELEEARAILEEARHIQGLDDETLGAIESAASNAEWIAGEFLAGIALLERAQAHFLRCNSRHVDTCEAVLAQRRLEVAAKLPTK